MGPSAEQAIHDGLLAVMRLSAEPMALSDPHQADMPLVAVNQAFLDLVGYPEDEVVGRNCRFLQGASTDRETVRRLGEVLRSGQGCVQWLANYRRDGTMFWNLLFISPVLGPDGRLLYFFANQHNLTAGSPDLPEFPIGIAHMPAVQQAEFHLLLRDVAAGTADAEAALDPRDRVKRLESVLVAARDVAALSLRLKAGASPSSV